jgi:hypothetical protein
VKGQRKHGTAGNRKRITGKDKEVRTMGVRKWRRYTEEEHEFLREYIPGHTHKEILAEFNKRFEPPLTPNNLTSYIANHNIKTGFTGRFEKGHVSPLKGQHRPTVGRMAETQFKKGHLPPNTKPVGYERERFDGHIEVKVRMRKNNPKSNDNFKLKKDIIWEAANGPIPKGYIVVCLDGNKRNFELENLRCISRAENLQMNRRGLRKVDAEMTETGILIARSILAVSNAKKRGKRDEMSELQRKDKGIDYDPGEEGSSSPQAV